MRLPWPVDPLVPVYVTVTVPSALESELVSVPPIPLLAVMVKFAVAVLPEVTVAGDVKPVSETLTVYEPAGTPLSV